MLNLILGQKAESEYLVQKESPFNKEKMAK